MLIEPEKEFLMAGDWHGNWQQAERVLDFGHRQGIKVIVQLGDFGIWENDKPYLNKMQDKLSEYDQILYFLDGNHEDFPRLYAKKLLDDGTRPVRDRIIHLPRGFRFTWGGISFLILGGAASIDRKFRTEGRNWWPEELLTDADIAKALSGGVADVMLTHDSPHSAPNTVTDSVSGQLQAMRYFGKENVQSCRDHQKRLQQVTDAVVPRLIFHGHYHERMRGDFRHQGALDEPCLIVGLDQGTSLVKNIYVFNLEREKSFIDGVDTNKKADILAI